MAFPERRTVNVLCTILLFAVVLANAYVARGVLVIFTFAILFAYLIDPVVRFLRRHSFIFRNLRVPHGAEAYLLQQRPHRELSGSLRSRNCVADYASDSVRTQRYYVEDGALA
jgi:hypothetical protein